MIVLFALLNFAGLIAVLITGYKTIRIKGGNRIKLALTALYTFSVALYLDGMTGMDLADKHGLDGSEPLIFGTWQLPIEYLLLLVILALQIYLVQKYAKRANKG